jgi:predicted CXXCH cytochrome family protein
MARASRFVIATAALLVAGWVAGSQDPAAPANHGSGAAAPMDCLRCHEAMRETVRRAVPHKPVLDGECAKCHAPHAARYPKLLNLRERALCATCHQEQLLEFMKGSIHTPVKQGQCSSCHEVHGSANDSLLTKEGNELCASCHEAKTEQAKLPTVHEPFGTGECLDCHKAHNSPFPSQLAAPATKLCQVCHPADAAELLAAHTDIPVAGTNCLGCHEPHATASKGLLRAVAHAPFAEGSCEMCHMTESDTPKVVRATGGRLCQLCHKDVPRTDEKLVHKPVAEGQCASCHVPHAGDRKGLLANATEPLCTSCHTEIAKRATESKSAHPVKDEKGSCLGCHSPHSSNEPHLLTAGEIRTCIQCHETAKHGHPLGDDRLDPRTGKPITCVTCHDPHGTAYAYQLRGDQSRGLCIECHDTNHEPVKDPSRGGQRK